MKCPTVLTTHRTTCDQTATPSGWKVAGKTLLSMTAWPPRPRRAMTLTSRIRKRVSVARTRSEAKNADTIAANGVFRSWTSGNGRARSQPGRRTTRHHHQTDVRLFVGWRECALRATGVGWSIPLRQRQDLVA